MPRRMEVSRLSLACKKKASPLMASSDRTSSGILRASLQHDDETDHRLLEREEEVTEDRLPLQRDEITDAQELQD